MAQENRSGTENRKRRVQRLKKMIIAGLIIGMTVPLVLCVILFVIAGNIRRTMLRERKEYDQRIETMEKQLSEQGDLIARLTELVSGITFGQVEPQEIPEPEEVQEAQKTVSEDAAEPATPEETAAHKVYLTFDDGPSSNTNEILDILKTYDVKATFFIVGKSGEADVEALKRIVEEGHALGMHSYSHKYAEIYSNMEAFASDFEAIHSFLYEKTGVDSHLYRFPGGSSNTVTGMDIQDCIAYLKEKDVQYFDWNISSGDASKQQLSADAIYNNCIAGIEKRSSSVILLHDAAGKKSTVEALPRVIETILGMEDTKILPLTQSSDPIQHVKLKEKEEQ